MIKDHMGRKWCLGAIRRSEARRGKAYDIVVFARPDLLWLRRVKPWCAYDSAHVLFSCPVLGCDMFWASPRQHAQSLLSQADMHRDCGESCDHGSCCCSYSEALFNYAKSRAAESRSPGLGELGWYWPPPLTFYFDRALGVHIERGSMYQAVRSYHEMRQLACDSRGVRVHLFGNTTAEECYASINRRGEGHGVSRGSKDRDVHQVFSTRGPNKVSENTASIFGGWDVS